MLPGHDYLDAAQVRAMTPDQDWSRCANGSVVEDAVRQVTLPCDPRCFMSTQSCKSAARSLMTCEGTGSGEGAVQQDRPRCILGTSVAGPVAPASIPVPNTTRFACCRRWMSLQRAMAWP